MKPDNPLRARLLKAMRSLDLSGDTETIQRALASAGLNRRPGSMQGVIHTIQQALSVLPIQEGSTASVPEVGEQVHPGEFVSRSFTNHAGTRTYKLYIPASYSYSAEPVPMLLMLHGGTQSPDDFAAGTRMNALAEQHRFLVVYPAQPANANPSKCWNWFDLGHQNRDSGEPSLLAGITREVTANYRVDEHGIFMAGLSAGAAMAVVMGATYPELYAAIGAHSGLPYGAAHDMPSAFTAMKCSGPLGEMPNPPGAPPVRRPRPGHSVPTIVFHGDQDQMVDARNGTKIVEEAILRFADGPCLQRSVQHGTAGGRTYSRTVYADTASRPVVEHWVLHGGGHAWSGGSTIGSFTDPRGPDASAEIVRFFYLQLCAGRASRAALD